MTIALSDIVQCFNSLSIAKFITPTHKLRGTCAR